MSKKTHRLHFKAFQNILKKILPVLRRLPKRLAALVDKYQNASATDGYLLCYLALPLILVYIIESLSHRSLIGGIQFIVFHPYAYLINVMIVAASMTLALISRKRIGVILLISIFWLYWGLANYTLQSYRVTPLTNSDLMLFNEGIGVAAKYLTSKRFFTITAVSVTLLVLTIIAAILMPKAQKKPRYLVSIPIILASFMLTWGGVKFGQSAGFLETAFRELSQSYLKNGFIYCFGASVLDTGISKPSDYSEEAMEQLTETSVEETEVEKETEDDIYYSLKPNIVIVQLESFFDVTRLKDVNFSRNPLPNFTKMMQSNASGAFSVPVVGAGTVNSEFEVLTGMNVDDFGIGEYPYKTVLKSTACESLAYDLSSYGYQAVAIHNHKGTFYDRNEVYPNLGFNVFDSLEYMWPDDYTAMDWAKDSVLVDEIEKALDSTAGQDFVFTVSVQGHGSYPTDSDVKYAHHVSVTSDTITDEGYMNQLNYYANQLYEMDQFVGRLYEMLRSRPEPTILVMYGDHCPSLDLEDEDLSSGTIYDTEYFIWNNCGFEFEDEDIEAYELGSRILYQLGISDGAINAYHQNSGKKVDEGTITEEDYLTGLKELEYDILYGSNITYSGENPYTPTELTMGFETISISGVSVTRDNVMVVTGENFTRFSKVYFNGEKVSTLYLDPNTLVVPKAELTERTEITVKQSSLSETSKYVYYPH